jgi:hypothetical protein
MSTVESGIKVENLALTVKAMKELGADRSALVGPGFKAATLLVRKSRPLVPFKTGNLETTLRPRKVTNGGSVSAGGAKAPYAGPIHWGWLVVGSSHKGKLKPGTYRGIKPQPFFSEALGYNRQEILDLYENAMKDLINNLPGATK